MISSRRIRILLILISIGLSSLTFLWLRPGELDLGGDGGRLIFYDPLSVIKNIGTSYISPFGTGQIEAKFQYLPFLLLLTSVNYVVGSSYMLIFFHNAVKLVVGFLSVYLIVKTLLTLSSAKINNFNTQIAAIVSGLFYIVNPLFIPNYLKSIPTNDQVFMNPLVFYLILQIVIRKKHIYVWLLLISTVLYSHNFSYTAAPAIFAFYPISIVFILFFTNRILKKSIPWKLLLITIILFMSLHTFHLVPEVTDLFSVGSNTNTRVFDRTSVNSDIDYFYGVLPQSQLYAAFLSQPTSGTVNGYLFIVLLIVITGFYLISGYKKSTLKQLAGLLGIVYLVIFYLYTAKIANVGILLYSKLYFIPGFGMFRNFSGQWAYTYIFYYSLLLGISIYIVFNKITVSKRNLLLTILGIIFTTIVYVSIKENLINKVLHTSDGVLSTVTMDPDYEETLSFIRSLPKDGKVLILPSSDYNYQVIYGLNDGAYVGSSTIGYLTGKHDFAGYYTLSPYSELFWQLSDEKDFDGIRRLLSLLNIRYIFHNSDPRIYDTTFPNYPYSPEYSRSHLPDNQKDYVDFISKITDNKIYENGTYNIYELQDIYYLPQVYPAYNIISYKSDAETQYALAQSFFDNKDFIEDSRIGYLEKSECERLDVCGKSYDTKLPQIAFERINLTKYKIEVTQAYDPFMLVFSETFSNKWQIILEETGALMAQKTHTKINGYANAWYITPNDTGNKSDYTLIVEFSGQKIFYVSLTISAIAFILFIVWGIKIITDSFFNNGRND